MTLFAVQWGHKQSLSLSTEESEKGQKGKKGKRPRKTTNLSDTVFYDKSFTSAAVTLNEVVLVKTCSSCNV